MPDIVAREPGINGGALWVYPHSGAFQGERTFNERVASGVGWNMHSWIGVAEITGDTPESENAAEAPADIMARRASDGALMVYPHSGTFNGSRTWQDPVIIGAGWNSMVNIVLADVTTDGFDDILAYDTSDNLWVYPHSGTFNGFNTFLPRVLLKQGRLGWLMATEWRRENADLVTASLATGEMLMAEHSQRFDGVNTHSNVPRTIATDIFAGSMTTSISLADLNGDGLDDVIQRMPNGMLLAYPFIGLSESPSLGDSALIGQGWNILDLIT
ncbi:hypothetical protein [Kibdelosporangium aridum]|uniref:hypothetical protein n=1 Tax=Kibdelosporangium aridum TaxID=2030 RepID=UPI0005277879